MNRMIETDWETVQAVTRQDEVTEVARAAIAFNWETDDMRVLGRLMSKIGLDLATAVRVFLNGRPEDFNYMLKDDVPLEESGRCSMLDCLHRKITCGFYLPDPQVGLGPVRAQAEIWMETQRRDQTRGVKGRWVFNPHQFDAISDNGPRTIVMTPNNDKRPTLLRVLMEPLWQ
ncbi:hypothetical protein [Thalassovita sp.]|uniref:hypothetical protein n=1 Tax=Thalassovita sp. TaxID=1979401 RepID=UPI0029DE8E66|nr:hypothetical protein [Thalassovita sp.]